MDFDGEEKGGERVLWEHGPYLVHSSVQGKMKRVQKLHISSVTVDLNIIVIIVVGEMFFISLGQVRGEGRGEGTSKTN